MPSGTHRNNRYHPNMPACQYNQDDIVVKAGSFWCDKYPARIIDVADASLTAGTPADGLACVKDDNAGFQGNGQSISQFWMAFSQVGKPSTGMTFYAATCMAGNTGNQVINNEQWQMAASGTVQTEGNDQVNGRTGNWNHNNGIEISHYGVCGMAGNIWEFVASWGQYGKDSDNDAGFGQGESRVYESTAYNGDFSWNVNGSANSNSTSSWSNNRVSCLLRGGVWYHGAYVGVFALRVSDAPSAWNSKLWDSGSVAVAWNS